MVLIRAENCTISCSGFNLCGYDPEQDELGNVCTLESYAYYVIFLVFLLVIGVVLRLFRVCYAKIFIPKQLKQIGVLNNEFKGQLNEAQNNHLQLRLSRNSVGVIFDLFKVIQAIIVLYLGENLNNMLNSFVSCTSKLAPFLLLRPICWEKQ